MVFRIFAGAAVPVLAFMLGLFLTPGWKGACKLGWFDCFHTGKVVLLPIALWAVIAFVGLPVCGIKSRPKPWVGLGVVHGALIAVVCLVQGVCTLDVHEAYWVLAIPAYVALWYGVEACSIVTSSCFDARTYLYSFLGVLPAWLGSLVYSFHLYEDLPEQSPDCFVVTAAMRGHPALVRPHFLRLESGRELTVTRQLLTLRQFEDMWATQWPQSHRHFRTLYNLYGPQIARRIRNPWVADVVYLAIKPLEWSAGIVLLLSQRTPGQNSE